MDYKEWFKEFGDFSVSHAPGKITIEKLYQNFKERMIAELFPAAQQPHPTQSSDQPRMHAPYTVSTVLLNQPAPPKDV